MKLHIFKDKAELSEKLAEWLVEEIDSVLKNQEYCSLVLSGGGTPQSLYEILAAEPFKHQINWHRIQLFWGDERVVPFDDPRNNAKNAFDLLINHVDIPANQVHIMRTDIATDLSVEAYSALLHRLFEYTTGSFDIVLLGMGNDGHTLSLFPGSPIIHDKDHWVKSVFNPNDKTDRITLMPVLVNRSSKIVFMVEGTGKAAVLKEVLEGECQPEKFPSQIIQPANGELHWFLDEACVKDLKKAG